jgi:hypothetical protein
MYAKYSIRPLNARCPPEKAGLQSSSGKVLTETAMGRKSFDKVKRKTDIGRKSFDKVK